MIKSDPILEQDILIGQYTLGLLSPQETHRVQALLARDSTAARTALYWEETFLILVDALPPMQPPASVLEQILITLDLPFPSEPDTASPADTPPLVAIPEYREPEIQSIHQSGDSRDPSIPEPTPEPSPRANTHSVSQPVTQQPVDTVEPAAHTASEPANGHLAMAHDRRRRSRRIWVGGATAVMLIVLLTLAFMPRQPAEPPVVIVEVAPSKGAILLAPGQSSTPGWVVTIDPENNATLTPQVHTETSADASVQLWTYNKTLRQPRSLGLIDPNQPVAIPAELMGEVGDDQFFEMTLEPAGGSPTAEPSGPILFIGRVVTFS